MRYAHILAATDFSEHGDLALRSAAELASTSGARLTVVHVMGEPAAPSPLLPHYHDPREDADRRAAARAEAERALRARIAACPGAGDAEVEVCLGDPAEEILALDARLRPGLIVLASTDRHGLRRWILGSVAERVMEHARADVLVVREHPE